MITSNTAESSLPYHTTTLFFNREYYTVIFKKHHIYQLRLYVDIDLPILIPALVFMDGLQRMLYLAG